MSKINFCLCSFRHIPYKFLSKSVDSVPKKLLIYFISEFFVDKSKLDNSTEFLNITSKAVVMDCFKTLKISELFKSVYTFLTCV